MERTKLEKDIRIMLTEKVKDPIKRQKIKALLGLYEVDAFSYLDPSKHFDFYEKLKQI